MRSGLLYWLFLAIITQHAASCQQSADTLLVSPENTHIEFTAKHFGIVNVSGTFKSFSGWLTVQNDIIISGHITLSSNSIFTNSQSRDRNLRDDEFLETQVYPSIIISFTNNNSPTLIQSQVRIKWVSNLTPINYEISHATPQRNSIEANSQISRKQFNLDFGTMDDLVSDKIEVSVLVTFSTR